MKTLVLGGSGFIGQEVTKALRANDNNAEVFATYFKNKKENTEIEFDIMNGNHIKSLTKNFKELDAVVFCYSAFEKEVLLAAKEKECFTQFENLDLELNKKILDAFGIQTLTVLKEIIPLLKKSQNPNIIFLGSLVGLKSALAPIGYSLSKSFTTGFLNSLSKELGEFNIKVNSINPGILAGGISQHLKEKTIRDYQKHTALKRFGTATEVANIAQWIINNNTYITGQSFLIDGGL